MSVITIGSIYKQNAVEDPVDKVTIKLDMSDIDDEILNVYSSMMESNEFIFSRTDSGGHIPINFIQKENKTYIYELETIPTEDIMLAMMYFDYYENDKLLENVTDEFLFSYKEIKVEDLKSEYIFKAKGEKLEINLFGAIIMVYTTNLEFSNIANIEEIPSDFAIISPLIRVESENEQERYIGIRNSQAKSIIIGSNFEYTDSEESLKFFEGALSAKDLTDSNVYNFSLKSGTIINIKIEGATDEEIENMTSNASEGMAFGFRWCSEDLDYIDFSEGIWKDVDLEREYQIRATCPNIPENIRFLSFFDWGWFPFYDEIYYLEKNGEEVAYYIYLDLNGAIKPNEVNELYITIKCLPDQGFAKDNYDTYAMEKIRWVDPNTGKAEIILENTGSYWQAISFCMGMEALYTYQLNETFVLSPEYENNPKWKIVNHISDEVNNEEIPIDIITIFKENTNLRYIYVEDTNTIYWKYNIPDFFYQGDPIYVYYKDFETINSQKEILTSQKSSDLKVVGFAMDLEYKYQRLNKAELKLTDLGFEHFKERNIVIQKSGEDGIYYIGLFEEDTLTKVEKLEVINGSGSIQINLENDDENKNYTIYEVDENGNKLNNVSYPVVFSNSYDIRNAEITSDKTIVSSVKSGIVNSYKDKYTASIEESEGTGEADYVDNMLSVTDIYQAKVTIGEEKEHKVTYETEEGGKLEGETEEYVKDGETPEKVPTPVPEEGYEFDKWVIVENGEEVEVNPSEYVITKDVTFIAKFKKVDKIVDIDTSDIQVWVYVVVVIVAVVEIVVVVIIVRKNKEKSKK